LYAVALVRSSWPLLQQSRTRSPHSFAARSVGMAQVWLVGSVLVWAVMAVTGSGWAQVELQFASLLGPLAGGFAGQVLLGSLCHLGPMILGGGPTAVRAARAVVEKASGARLVLVNGGLLLFALPAPSLVRVSASMLALLGAAWTFGLIIASVFVSRRARATAPTGPTTLRPAEVLAASSKAPKGSGIAAGVALLVVTALSVAADPASVGVGAAADGGVAATGNVVEIEVEARDMRFDPSTVTVDAGDELVLIVTNVDSTVHDLVLDSGATTGRIAPGATSRIDVGVVGRQMDGWCSIAGHRQMGMTFTINVEGAPSDDPASGGHDHGDHMASGSGGTVDLHADPAPGFEAFDASLAPAPDATVHRHTLTVTEQVMEVAPGVTQTLWTYNGQVPGPTLRGKVGDTFEITLVNDGTLGHSIDFHAGALAPDEPMRTIEPGESLTYTFTATRSGIWMYHCSTMPMTLHIANGMFGAVIIDPPDLPEVDREYLLVQSEYYLGAQGEIADSEKLLAEQVDAVVFNGYANQYGHDPLEARVGERVRFWVLDVGPNRPSSFHVVGGQFDTVYAEGTWQLGGPHAAGLDPSGGSQVLGLHVAQGGFVELEMPEAGHYPFVTHVMIDAERGAHGILHVTE
ncbi:MAG: multicopper oxidase domain-containing protein, partial [Actinomycetales bacterium]|nr:multicopper oxidase domain-containing protein [Actinomycetales bacterium]